MANIAFQHESTRRSLVDLGIENRDAITSAVLRLVHCDVGVAKERLFLDRLTGRRVRNPDAYGRTEFGAVCVERESEGCVNVAGNVERFVLSEPLQNDCKLVAADPTYDARVRYDA